MEWLWRRFFLPLVLAVALFSFTTTVAMAEPPAIKLQPANNTEYIFDSVELLEYSDQCIRFKVKGHRQAGDEPMRLSITIDPQGKTYTAVKKPLTGDEQLEEDVLQDQQSVSPESTLKTYTAKIGVVTEDLVNIDCCKSWLQLNWTVDLDYNQVAGYSKNKGQWDGQPTLAGTYWYCLWHNYTSYCGYDSSSAWAQSVARHRNYDWGDNDVATYAEHNMILDGGANGNWTYECEWSHWGEDFDNLHGSVYFP